MRTYTMTVTLVQSGNTCTMTHTVTVVAQTSEKASFIAQEAALRQYPAYPYAYISAISCQDAPRSEMERTGVW